MSSKKKAPKNGPVVDSDGNQCWFRDGKKHRDDGPAEIWADGSQLWFRDGKLHRDDGPTIIRPDGTQVWYRNDQPHRDDGPAVIRPDGTQRWCREGKLHREDGPAEVRPDGYQIWGLFIDNSEFVLAGTTLRAGPPGTTLRAGPLNTGRTREFDLADPDGRNQIRKHLSELKITPVGWLADLVK
jgi:hypothetical protein